MGRYRQQRGRPLQAGPQIILILPRGKELVASPVHGDQHTQGLDDIGSSCAREVLGESLGQVPG